MAKRAVIEIDEEKCDGCGLCAGGCHEGALRIIDGKARLVGESLCDGLGACVGECPRGALRTVEREVEDYDERRVIENILPKGMNTVAAHLDHLRVHGQDTWLAQARAVLAEKGLAVPEPEPALPGCGASFPEPRAAAGTRGSSLLRPAAPASFAAPRIDNGISGGCPGSAARSFASGAGTPASTPARPKPALGPSGAGASGSLASRLEQWPVQLHLVNPRAPYFRGADLLIAADCTAFACGAFHQALLAGRRLVIACPKLDHGREVYLDKIRALIDESEVASVTVAIMEVPCCGGLSRLVQEAAASASRAVPISTVVVGIEGGGLTWM
ncbi:MAG TPA: 4Fe-4S ferredoxin [Spirochaetia bacterium]|nr:4Fe-4S ferredoxin [Spirochaetales bacterium]HRY79898.1 4Fe-4S ferredoxin [Spirochaetia bacterium]